MSHPNPSHDPENEYPSDHFKPSGKMKKMVAKTRKSGHIGVGLPQPGTPEHKKVVKNIAKHNKGMTMWERKNAR